MKIAWVTYDFLEYSILQVNALAKQHELLLVMPAAETESSHVAVSNKVRQFLFNKPRLRQPFKQWSSVRSIISAICEFDPDVIHYQQGHLWFNFGLPALKQYPLVITVHDPRHHAGDVVSRKTPQWIIDYGFRKADHLIVHGTALKHEVERLFKVPENHVHVLPHVAMGGISCKAVVCEEPRSILFFGRIWDYKGLSYLIRAEPMIAQEFPDIRIIIAGMGEDFSRYEAIMEHPERFEVHNRWISDEERGRFFQRAAIVVLPYTEATQSGVVPVAYHFQRPVIATSVGALPECVEHEATGLLVPPRNPEALAAAIIRLLKDSPLRRQMGAAGHAKLVQESSPHAVAQQTAEVYRQALLTRRNQDKSGSGVVHLPAGAHDSSEAG